MAHAGSNKNVHFNNAVERILSSRLSHSPEEFWGREEKDSDMADGTASREI